MFHLDSEARGFTPRTIEFYRQRLGMFLRYCDEQEVVALADLTHILMPRLEQKVLSALTGTEVQAALQACEYERDKALLLFMLDTDGRNSELCALNVGDVAEDGAVTVQMGKGQKGRMA